ncbi:MAG: hypothetical protein ACRD2H_10240 [Terriglobales bacterium]
MNKDHTQRRDYPFPGLALAARAAVFNDGRKRTSFKLILGSTSEGGHRWFSTLGPTF